MNESFLHYIWQHKLMNALLFTTEGEKIHILKLGSLNTNAGPDFIDARICIGNTVWAGCVEVHKKTSDWFAHKHDQDPCYHTVILHLVYEHDHAAPMIYNNPIPTLELKNQVSELVWDRYLQMNAAKERIVCREGLKNLDTFFVEDFFQRLSIERIENKCLRIRENLQKLKQSWSQCFYQSLAQYFGGNVNKEVFEALVLSFDSRIIDRNKDRVFQLEALLFGQAGLLNKNFVDAYPNALKAEYAFLKKKHELNPLPPHRWKWMRLRPASFPEIRISQFAHLMSEKVGLFSAVLEAEKLHELISLFRLKASEYWTTHSLFDKQRNFSSRETGSGFISILLINVVVPFLFEYGRHTDQEQYKERAFALLQELKPENNKIIREWVSFGLTVKNAMHSQALLLLHQEFCMRKRCLSCHFFYRMLKS